MACETSGVVRDAFRAQGHDAISCDLLPSRAPGPHYQCNVLNIIGDYWDLMIAHPPCTYLCCSAEWAYADQPMIKGKPRKIKPGTLIGKARREARSRALDFVRILINAPIDKICIENPVGVISTQIKPASQYIQPYEFGEDASKRTGLWLKNLPFLKNTRHINPRIINGRPRWSNQTDSGQCRQSPSATRWQIRSNTYQGIADAFAKQWSET